MGDRTIMEDKGPIKKPVGVVTENWGTNSQHGQQYESVNIYQGRALGKMKSVPCIC